MHKVLLIFILIIGFSHSNSSSAYSLGIGLPNGFVGFNSFHSIQQSNLAWQAGLGLEGLSFGLNWTPDASRAHNPYLNSGILYSAWDFLLFAEDSFLWYGKGGYEFWSQDSPFFTHLGFGLGVLVAGQAEGNESLIPMLDLQLGFSF